jgi:hypothetical protein
MAHKEGDRSSAVGQVSMCCVMKMCFVFWLFFLSRGIGLSPFVRKASVVNRSNMQRARLWYGMVDLYHTYGGMAPPTTSYSSSTYGQVCEFVPNSHRSMVVHSTAVWICSHYRFVSTTDMPLYSYVLDLMC